MDSDSINIPGVGPLPFIDKSPQNFFRRTTIAYGPSETGKSVITKWIMEILQPYIPNVIVICPTDGANDGYRGIVPERCIFTKIDVKTLQDIWRRQEEAVETYNRANRIDVLKSLFNKANDLTSQSIATRIERLTKTSLDMLANDRRINSAQRKEQTKAIEKSLATSLRNIYKKTIRNYGDRLQSRRDINEDERYAIKYIDFNPSLLLVMDDCQAEIAEWIKDTTVGQLFYQGRHQWVTTIMTMQSDTGKPGLPPGIRRNTFNNFFTDPNVAMSFFNNSANAFPNDIKKQASKCITEIFKENGSGIENYKRFVYSRLDKIAKLRYVIADEPENLRFGCPALWKLCDSIPVDPKKQSASSKFSACFGVK